ncbi:MAG: ACT domain-containing protein, partial [Armatimonadetes bacterium]|nr:ACT domain-containing protein [Armatimonadota bacterium]
IYTHVDGVMTADPDVVPGARTLSMVTYEEVCNMAHQGAKVLHPRAAEIAMLHQIPLWVKTSFERKQGTLIAPLKALGSPQEQQVTGVATLARLVYFTLLHLAVPDRARIEYEVYRTVGEAGINFYLNSIGPGTSSFLVERAHAARTAGLLRELGVVFEWIEDCEMVSVVALHMWEAPGFLLKIAESLYGREITVLQMADAECSVSCLVKQQQAAAAVQALHDAFELSA